MCRSQPRQFQKPPYDLWIKIGRIPFHGADHIWKSWVPVRAKLFLCTARTQRRCGGGPSWANCACHFSVDAACIQEWWEEQEWWHPSERVSTPSSCSPVSTSGRSAMHVSSRCWHICDRATHQEQRRSLDYCRSA